MIIAWTRINRTTTERAHQNWMSIKEIRTIGRIITDITQQHRQQQRIIYTANRPRRRHRHYCRR